MNILIFVSLIFYASIANGGLAEHAQYIAEAKEKINCTCDCEKKFWQEELAFLEHEYDMMECEKCEKF